MPKIVFSKQKKYPYPTDNEGERINLIRCAKWCEKSILKYMDTLKTIDSTSSNSLISQRFSDAGKDFQQYWKTLGVKDSRECRLCFFYLLWAGDGNFTAGRDMIWKQFSKFFKEVWPIGFDAEQPSLDAEKSLMSYNKRLDSSTYSQLSRTLKALLSRLQEIRKIGKTSTLSSDGIQ